MVHTRIRRPHVRSPNCKLSCRQCLFVGKLCRKLRPHHQKIDFECPFSSIQTMKMEMKTESNDPTHDPQLSIFLATLSSVDPGNEIRKPSMRSHQAMAMPITGFHCDLHLERATMLAIFITFFFFIFKFGPCHQYRVLLRTQTFKSVRKCQLSAASIRWWFQVTQYQRLTKIKIRYVKCACVRI